jgi:hypothetical protein
MWGTAQQQCVWVPGIGQTNTAGACEPLPVRSRPSLFITTGPADRILAPAPMAAAPCSNEQRRSDALTGMRLGSVLHL